MSKLTKADYRRLRVALGVALLSGDLKRPKPYRRLLEKLSGR